MRKKGLEWGVFFITLGILWILIQGGIIDWSIVGAFWVLWPLMLVVLGVNIIFKGNTLVKSASWLLFLTVLIGYAHFYGNHDQVKSRGDKRQFSVEKIAETEYGELEVALGGSNITLEAGTGNLVDGSVTSTGIEHTTDYQDGKKTARIGVSKKKYFEFGRSSFYDDCTLQLNQDVLWDLKMNVGAVDAKLDMAQLKVRSLEIGTGVSKFEMRLGTKYPSPQINVDAGVSQFRLVVPKEMGVRVRLEGALNSTDLDGLEWNETSGAYTSSNYEEAGNKANVTVKMGVGKFDVDFE